jgi:diketogulonate reductase-like aldo/keto reductase
MQIWSNRSASWRKPKKVTPAQVALAWLLAQKPWIVPIPGTTKKHRMEENAGGADVTLSKGDLEALATLLSHMTVQGNPLHRSHGSDDRQIIMAGFRERSRHPVQRKHKD